MERLESRRREKRCERDYTDGEYEGDMSVKSSKVSFHFGEGK